MDNENAVKMKLREAISKLGEARLPDAVSVIEAHGLRNPHQVLEALGYTVLWAGLDSGKTRIKRVGAQHS